MTDEVEEPAFDLYEVMKEALPEIAEKFIEDYIDADLKSRWVVGSPVFLCTRCGSFVEETCEDEHKLWHRNVSAALFLLQGWSLNHMMQHEES